MTQEMTISWVKKNQRSSCHGLIISQRLYSNKHSHKMTVLTSAKIICGWLHDYNHHGELMVASVTWKKKSNSQVDGELPKQRTTPLNGFGPNLRGRNLRGPQPHKSRVLNIISVLCLDVPLPTKQPPLSAPWEKWGKCKSMKNVEGKV